MNEQSSTGLQTGLDKIFAALRGIGVRRRTDSKWIAGVCSGLADRLGIDPVIVRAALVLLSLLWGVGLTVYLLAWALLPNDRNQIAAERAVRDGDGGSVVLVVIAALALFGGSWWGGSDGWGFPWGLVLTGLIIWWVVQRSRNNPDADQRVSAHQSGTPAPTAPSAPSAPSTATAGSSPTTSSPASTTFSPALTAVAPSPSGSGPSQTTPRPVVPRQPRRRSGGARMALVAVGLALVTYGTLNWLGNEYAWTGNHVAIALAGSLAAMGLLLVGLGLAGWRSGFVAFLTIVLAISALSSTVVPTGIHFAGPVGDETWKPTSVTSGSGYRLGAGDGTLDLSGLPTEGLLEARIPAYVGLGELRVIVPAALTVQVVGHVGLGDISLPGEARRDEQGGTDLSQTTVVGDGPVEVVVDAGVGVGQLTVVKE